MKRGGYLRRKARLRPVNPERREARKAASFGPQAALCREGVCCVQDCRDFPEPHHEPPRGSTGGLDEDTVPLCRIHHSARHAMPLRDFERKYRVDLLVVRAEMRRRVYWDEKGSNG